MYRFDLAISYTWEYDEEFVNLIENRFQKYGLRTFVIKKFNVHEVVDLLRSKKISFKFYLDRASDEDRDFEAITKILRKRKCHIINPHHMVRKVTDKAFMHKKLEKKNFLLPKSFILQPFDLNEELKISNENLRTIGIPFIIKPSQFSGGGEGVEKNGKTLDQIQIERKKSHSERYLVQEKIYPKIINGKRAWFRIFWAFNKVIPCWWDDQTHIYAPVTKTEIKRYHLQQLIKITRRLARLTFLDYFSTEIALTKKHQFILIDYINDQCDMRLQSLHPDGVPDQVVIQFIEEMKKKVITH